MGEPGHPRFRDLLVLAAMEEEERAIAEALDSFPSASGTFGTRLRIPYRRFTVGSTHVTLVRSGIGPVNAALAVVIVAEHSDVDGVFLFGVGGAVSPELAIGDIVFGTHVLQHDSFSSLDFGHAHMPSGEYILSQEDADRISPLRAADVDTLASLEKVFGTKRFHRGVVLSGNEFVGTVARKAAIAALHPEALLVDMEAAGVAHAAGRLGIPFLVAKTVSDRLAPDGSIESDFRKCLEFAAVNAAEALRILLAV
jgi:5'-methylthioadenosine/S-adenosylhomocysteine nucleosidase